MLRSVFVFLVTLTMFSPFSFAEQKGKRPTAPATKSRISEPELDAELDADQESPTPTKKEDRPISYIYQNAFKNEVIASGTFGQYSTGQEIKGSSDKVSRLVLEADYRRQILKGIQVGALVEFQNVSAGSSYSCTNLFGSFVYNFAESWNLSNTSYALGLVGLADESCGLKASDKKLSFGGGFGKRYSLAERISYMPEVGLKKIGENDLLIYLKFLNFSFAF